MNLCSFLAIFTFIYLDDIFGCIVEGSCGHPKIMTEEKAWEEDGEEKEGGRRQRVKSSRNISTVVIFQVGARLPPGWNRLKSSSIKFCNSSLRGLEAGGGRIVPHHYHLIMWLY